MDLSDRDIDKKSPWLRVNLVHSLRGGQTRMSVGIHEGKNKMKGLFPTRQKLTVGDTRLGISVNLIASRLA